MHFKKNRQKDYQLGAKAMHTLELHRLPISCSTWIDREGKKFTFPASF